MKTIKVLSTKGKRVTNVETEATKWGQLQEDLKANGLEIEGMKAIVFENQTTLESPDAVLPVGLNINGTLIEGFTLFLTPIKTKSGADVKSMGYKELKAEIKKLRENNDDAKAFFGNYTQMSTEDLRKLLSSFLKKSNGGVKPAPVAKVEEKVACESEAETNEINLDDPAECLEQAGLLIERAKFLIASNSVPVKKVVSEPKVQAPVKTEADDLMDAFDAISGNFNI